MGNGLTAEEIERNEIVTQWFQSDEVNRFLGIWMYRNPKYRELEIKEDLRQETFIWLLNQPISYLRNLNFGKQWVGLLNKMIITPHIRGTFFKQFIDFPIRTCEFEEIKINSLLKSTHPEIFKGETEEDLIMQCIIEIDKLPHMERWCMELYIKHPNEAAILADLRNTGWPTANNYTLKKNLSKAIDKIQSNLLKKGLIAETTPFTKVISLAKKYDPHKSSPSRISENMIRLVSLLDNRYDEEWSLSNKVFYVLLHHTNPLTAREIFDILSDKYETAIVNKYINDIAAVTDISGCLRDFGYIGIICKKKLKGPKNEYFFPCQIIQYIEQVNNCKLGYEKVPGTMWKIFLYHSRSRQSIEEIAQKFNLTEKETQSKLITAKQIIDSLVEQKRRQQYA